MSRSTRNTKSTSTIDLKELYLVRRGIKITRLTTCKDILNAEICNYACDYCGKILNTTKYNRKKRNDNIKDQRYLCGKPWENYWGEKYEQGEGTQVL